MLSSSTPSPSLLQLSPSSKKTKTSSRTTVSTTKVPYTRKAPAKSKIYKFVIRLRTYCFSPADIHSKKPILQLFFYRFVLTCLTSHQQTSYLSISSKTPLHHTLLAHLQHSSLSPHLLKPRKHLPITLPKSKNLIPDPRLHRKLPHKRTRFPQIISR
jgi:hypothetical protein